MIMLTCDKCERPIEVADDQAGTKVTCPHCGDVNVVRAPTAPSDPARERTTAAEPERRVMLVRPAMFRARPGVFLLLLAAVLGGAGGAAYVAYNHQPAWWAWACLVVAAVGLAGLGAWKVATMGASLEVTNRRTISSRGLLGRETSEVMHADIRNLQIKQSFWQRIKDVGEVGISSSAQDDIEIDMKDIPRPYHVRDVIDAYRKV